MGRLTRIALGLLIVAGVVISIWLFLLGLQAMLPGNDLAWWGLILISLPMLAMIIVLPLVWVWLSRRP